MSEDITSTIEDSITDVELGSDPIDEAPYEPVEAPTEPSDTPDTGEPAPEPSDPDKAPQDEFDKRFGITSQSSSGRENRIPYSRVKKITEKAVNDAKSDWNKQLATGYVPSTKYTELEARTRDYEARLTQVAEFEKVMANDQVRFLQMLYKQPGYKEIFDQLAAPQTPPEAPQAEVPVSDDMPQPDQDLSDGSKVYSLEGLKALLAWQDQKTAARTMDKVMKQVEARYAPLENSYNSYQRVQAVIPQVQRQIDDARTWPLFNESEDEIVKVLQQYPQVNLERAYQHVVFPKMRAEQARLANEAKVNKETVRAQILQELRAAPRSTATTSGPSRPVAPQTGGNRSIEQVIEDSIKGLR